MAKTFEVAFRLGAELTKSFNDAFKTANKSMDSLVAASDRMNKMGKSLSARVTAPLVGVGAAVLKIGSDFDSQMSAVAAVSGATGRDFDALRQQAQDLGATTKFMATQVAEGQEYLALAGYDTQQILGATEGVLNLAAAGAMDLGMAADITSDVMSAFGMAAEEAGHAADVFAYAQANANTNVEQAGEAMKYLAPLANQMGWSIEESTAAVMKLADNGLKGGIAGQALASSIARLAKPTKEMSKTMNQLGISFFDAHGNMKSLPDVVKELEVGTKGLTMQQKSAAISTIFGAEAYKHWAILLESGSDTLAQYTDELINSDGTAKRMADTMVDNLAGSLLMLRSAMEGVAIQLSDLVKGDLRTLVDYLTVLTGRFAALSDNNKKLVILFAAVAASIGPVLIGLSVLITSYINVRSAIIATSAAIKGLTVVQMLGAKVMRLYRAATLAYMLSGGGFAGVMGVMTAAVRTLNAAILANPIIAIVAAVVALGTAFYFAYKNSETFRNAVNSAFSKINEIVMSTVNFMKNSVPGMWNDLVSSASAFGSRFNKAVSNSLAGIASLVLIALSSIDGLISDVKGIGERIGVAIGLGVTSMTGGFLADYIGSMKMGFSSLPGIISLAAPMLTTMGLSFLGIGGPVGLVIGAVVSLAGFLFRLSQTNEGVASTISAAWKGVLSALSPIIEVFNEGFAEFAEEVGPQLSETIEVMRESFAALGPSFAEVGASFVELGALIFSMWSEVASTIVTSVLPSLLEVFQTVFPLIIEIIGSVIPLAIQILMSIVPIILTLAKVVIPLILTVVQTVFPLIVAIISSVIPIIVNILTSIIPVILTLVEMIIPLVLTVVQTVFPVVLAVIQSVLPVFISLLVTVIDVILQLTQTVIPLILAVVQTVLPIVLAIIQSIIPVIAAVLQILVAVINGVVIPAINAILAVVQVVFPYIQMIIENALAIINGIIQTAMALLQGDWSGAWEAIKVTAETIMNNIISFFQGINLFEVGKSIITGLIDGIKSMGSAVLGAITNMVPAPIRGVVEGVIGKFNGYAEGGIVTAPELAWIGEGGDTESVIPWNNSQRSKMLWLQTGRALGMLGDAGVFNSGDNDSPFDLPSNSTTNNSGGQTVIHVVNKPTIVVRNEDSKKDVEDAFNQSNRNLLDELEEEYKNRKRREFD